MQISDHIFDHALDIKKRLIKQLDDRFQTVMIEYVIRYLHCDETH